MRLKLTLWFMALVILLYALDTSFAFTLLNKRLFNAVDRSLAVMCYEVTPEVRLQGERPTLREWGSLEQQKLLDASSSVQLFDRERRLIERYGWRGIPELNNGPFTRAKMDVFSHFISLPAGGFLQVQMPQHPLIMTFESFISQRVVRGSLMAVVAALCGWFLSGKAVSPVERTLETLRTFVDDAGHELNTPIAVIENSLEVLEARLQDRGQHTDVLFILQRASTRLKNIANNLLLLAKMEQRERALRATVVKPKDILADVIADFNEQACVNKVELIVKELPDETIKADRYALYRLFAHLIENAIRYTPAGGRVEISGAKKMGILEITIADTGIGIPESCIPYIFDRFYRVDEARSRAEGGNGLGLSIVKAIADAHGAAVSVQSQPQKGSTFTVSLPTAA
jgi:signal transduction histidine kinase